MIVRLTVDINGDDERTVVISVPPSANVGRVVQLLRQRLRLSSGARVSIRHVDGSPVPEATVVGVLESKSPGAASTEAANSRKESTDDTASPPISALMLFAIVDVPHMLTDTASSPASSSFLGVIGDDDGDASTCSSSSSSNDSGHDDENERELTQQLVDGIGIHTIRVNRSYRKAYATRRFECGDVIAKEHPLISVPYPKQLVETVRRSEKLSELGSYDRGFSAGMSPINGLSDEAYAKYLSIAMIHGRRIETGGRFQHQMAFYPDTAAASCRHSCHPNAEHDVVSLTKAPFEGRLRCAAIRGIDSGDEVTIFYHNMDTRQFALLPFDRRQQLLQHAHVIASDATCECSRCWKGARGCDESEAPLSGAFFEPVSAPGGPQRANAAAVMRRDFDTFCLLKPRCVGVPDKEQEQQPTQLLDDAVLRAVVQRWRDEENLPPPAAGIVHAASASCFGGSDIGTFYTALCRYAKELSAFIARYTKRDAAPTGPPSEEANPVQLLMHRYHWRLSLARVRLLDAMEWLLMNRGKVKRLQQQEGRDSDEAKVDNGPTTAAPPAPPPPPVPFSKQIFLAALDQLQTEAVYLPAGHPLTLQTYRQWRRMMRCIPHNLAAMVQQKALDSEWCPDVQWDALQAADRVW